MQPAAVTQPLALVCYQKLMPGSQLVNRLQDMHYRVQPITEPEELIRVATEAGAMVIFLDLESSDALAWIARLRANSATSHLPIIAFGEESAEAWETARQKGATLVASSAALLDHLPALLEQALRIE